jgi:hypothetical protein
VSPEAALTIIDRLNKVPLLVDFAPLSLFIEMTLYLWFMRLALGKFYFCLFPSVFLKKNNRVFIQIGLFLYAILTLLNNRLML